MAGPGRAPGIRGPAFWLAEPAMATRMNLPTIDRPSSWTGFWLAQLLSAVFLAGCLWWLIRDLAFVLPNYRITAALSIERSPGAVLGLQLAAFAGALLFCHMLLGLAAYGIARLVENALAGTQLPSRRWLVSFVFFLMVGLVMAANSTRHPGSLFAGEESWFRTPLMIGLRAGDLLVLVFAAIVLVLALRALRRTIAARPAIAVRFAGAGVSVIAAALVLPLVTSGSQASSTAVVSTAPHVVIIGVDSLRDDLAGTGGETSLTPQIDRFLDGAYRFRDTTTPLARTFPAWVSILTGRHPVSTGARFNLMPRELVREGETIGTALRKHGYRAVYATDEVRFANIDETFGFDQLITPPIGAIDFLLGHAGDLPIVNLAATTWMGGMLFPSNHANRAAHLTYQPEQFVERLADEIEVQGPTLLAIHLTLAHWPYAWGGDAALATPQEYRPGYRRSVAAVDRQFRQVMSVLEDKGVLDNAIVVLLSDHGEALGGKTDSMLRGTGTSQQIWRTLWGHGTSVLSPHQYQVLLAMRTFGRAQLSGKPGNYDWPVTLEDLRPTLEQFVTGTAPAGVDGHSLLPAIAEPGDTASLQARIRFTETGFNTDSTLAGRYEASGLIDEAAVYYELDAASGRVQFRRARLPQLLARKQRAAISSSALLAAVPDWNSGTTTYLFTDRQNPLPRPLLARPDPRNDPEAARLWDALQERFPGELPPAPSLP